MTGVPGQFDDADDDYTPSTACNKVLGPNETASHQSAKAHSMVELVDSGAYRQNVEAQAGSPSNDLNSVDDIMNTSDELYEEYDHLSEDEEDLDAMAEITIDDQWFDSSKDFTKQFNRMRAHMAGFAPTTSSFRAPLPTSHDSQPHCIPGSGGIQSVMKNNQADLENDVNAKSTSFNTGATHATNSRASELHKTAIKGQILNRIESRLQHSDIDKGSTELIKKFSSRINLNNNLDLLRNDIRATNKKGDDSKYLNKDKSDRATVEQVLDPRTRMILFKMLNKNVIYEVNGCISTGKEANVYHALTQNQDHMAIKIYKTSILTFKDRDRYVSGEFRFRHGYSKSNPRKMVQTWAEKEMRNLKRLHVAGIPCPEPILLRLHVLLMTFIGDKKGWAAPRLKDAVITDEATYRDLYRQLLKILWTMFHKCKLVHADFSEYNLLYQKKKIYVIDVSQSVEHDHPHALEFLRKDCANVVDYFRKRLTEQIMTLREIFDFVVSDLSVFVAYINEHSDDSVVVDNSPTSTNNETTILDRYLDMTHIEISKRPSTYLDDNTVQSNEQVFKNVFIPRTLDEIQTAETDIQKIRDGDDGDILYKMVTGLKVETPGAKKAVKVAANGVIRTYDSDGDYESSNCKIADLSESNSKDSHNANVTPQPDITECVRLPEENCSKSESVSGSNSSDSDSSMGDESENPDDSSSELPPKRKGTAATKQKKFEDKDVKRERHRLVKEAKREKRKSKMPKSVKKRKEKLSSSRK
ncbi:hypothetical protein BASA61_000482 [Batrachochytrium salamandrivorans]|nr:hypothetical protein BASA62_005456 [Batrachochytrium salamandrivorans]KAH6603068.1 hypothetical protein BASA61_000482 [Batrachochytrium salamandrivorans]KAH9263675.1 hypothetical protein BASA83_012915 [Batrachochytrium salamandrivorans]